MKSMFRATLAGLILAGMVAGFTACSNSMQCRSRQSEAKIGLKTLYRSMEAMFLENNVLPKTIQEAKFEPEANSRYQFQVVASSDDGKFIAEARGTGEMEGDVWRIDQTGNLTEVTNKCK